MASAPSYIKNVESFNRNLKTLVRDIVSKCPNDALIARVQKRVMTVIALEPLKVINSVGPYLYKYRDQIYNTDENSEDFFLENSFDAELNAEMNKEKVDMVSYIIPKTKECARNLPKAEKEEYKALVIALLDDYVEYLIAIKS